MNAIQLRTRIFTDSYSRRDSETVLDIVLNALVAIDVLYLQHNPHCPRLYQSGVRYYHEGIVDEWFDIPEALHEHVADCKGLSAWRVAELRVSGEDLQARCDKTFAELRDDNGSVMLLYHIRVRRGDGSIEDPSRRLGMNQTEPDGYMPLRGVPWAVANGMQHVIGAALGGDSLAQAQLDALRDCADGGNRIAVYFLRVGRLIRERGYDPAKKSFVRGSDNAWGWK